MIRTLILLGSILFYTNTLIAQNICDHFINLKYVQESCELQYDKPNPKKMYIVNSTIIKNNKYRRVFFNDDFNNDSVVIYFNNNIVSSKRITTDHVLSYADNEVIKSFSRAKFNFLTVIMPEKKTFIELPFDNRYYYLKIWHIDNTDKSGTWIARFSNNIPLYE